MDRLESASTRGSTASKSDGESGFRRRAPLARICALALAMLLTMPALAVSAAGNAADANAAQPGKGTRASIASLFRQGSAAGETTGSSAANVAANGAESNVKSGEAKAWLAGIEDEDLLAGIQELQALRVESRNNSEEIRSMNLEIRALRLEWKQALRAMPADEAIALLDELIAAVADERSIAESAREEILRQRLNRDDAWDRFREAVKADDLTAAQTALDEAVTAKSAIVDAQESLIDAKQSLLEVLREVPAADGEE